MKIITIPAITVAALLVLSACAATPPIVNHVSPTYYDGLSCEQLNDNALSNNRQNKDISNKKISQGVEQGAVVVASIFFPPAAFLLPGDTFEQEIAKLKGEAVALKAAGADCNIVSLDILETPTTSETKKLN